jgi:hypothetical protein
MPGAPLSSAPAAAHLREHQPQARWLLLNSGDAADDLEGVTLVGPDDEPDVVVLGVGDDLEASVLVRTGKCRDSDEQGAHGERPRHVLDSAAALPGLLGI